MEIKEMVIHTTENSKYQIQFEQAATKGVLGFKVAANNDDLEKAQLEADILLRYAKNKAEKFIESATPVEVK